MQIRLYIKAQNRFSLIFKRVFLPSFIAFTKDVKLLLTKTTSPESIAISLPAPIATPREADVRAGASFIPSPTMHTFPSALSEFIIFALSLGFMFAMTLSIPTRFAMLFAVVSLSPLSIYTLIPNSFNLDIASILSSFNSSSIAMIPSNVFWATNIGVFPSLDRLSILDRVSFSIETSWDIKSTLPINVSMPLTLALTPLPDKASKSFISSGAILFDLAYLTIAWARGCSLCFSTE